MLPDVQAQHCLAAPGKQVRRVLIGSGVDSQLPISHDEPGQAGPDYRDGGQHDDDATKPEVMVGGGLEYFSMLSGYRLLLIPVIIFYACALLLRLRSSRRPGAGDDALESEPILASQ